MARSKIGKHYKSQKDKLAKRQQAWEITYNNMKRGKYYDGYHKPGSTNRHKQG